MDMLCRVNYVIKGIEKSPVRFVPGIKKMMQKELFKAYNVYAEKCNAVTDGLNKAFKAAHPNYFEEHDWKSGDKLVEYYKFMAKGWQRLVVKDLNASKLSRLLSFYVDPNDECVFVGRLKADKKVNIRFYIKLLE